MQIKDLEVGSFCRLPCRCLVRLVKMSSFDNLSSRRVRIVSRCSGNKYGCYSYSSAWTNNGSYMLRGWIEVEHDPLLDALGRMITKGKEQREE